MTDHDGAGEAVAFVDIAADDSGRSAVGLHNSDLGLAVVLKFKKQQLPCFINWQHWGNGEYVTGLEPGTHRAIGQSKARAQKELIFIEPGEIRQYDLELEVLTEKNSIQDFIRRYGA
jgi:hypothetical protein